MKFSRMLAMHQKNTKPLEHKGLLVAMNLLGKLSWRKMGFTIFCFVFLVQAQASFLLCSSVFSKNYEIHGPLNFDRAVREDSLISKDDSLHGSLIQANWRPGDYTHKGFRAEVADPYLAEHGVPILYRLRFFIPEHFPLDRGKSVIIAQFHTNDSAHKPQIGLRYRSTGVLDLSLNFLLPKRENQSPESLQLKPLRIEDFRKGEWHDLAMYIQWNNQPGGEGFVHISLNSVHILTFRGQNNYQDVSSGPYFKFGIYPYEGNSQPLSMEHSNYGRILFPGSENLEKVGLAKDSLNRDAEFLRGQSRRRIEMD